MKIYTIAAIPGDGIGQEVIAAGLDVLSELARRDGAFKLDVQNFDWGTDHYKRHGVLMPADGLRKSAMSTRSTSARSARRMCPIT